MKNSILYYGIPTFLLGVFGVAMLFLGMTLIAEALLFARSGVVIISLLQFVLCMALPPLGCFSLYVTWKRTMC